MANFTYNPVAEYIVLKFKCPECGEEVITDALSVPSPDFTAETHRDSINSDWFEANCENCDHGFTIDLNTGFYGGDGMIDDVDEILEVEEEIADNDYENFDQELYEATHTEIEHMLDSFDTIPESLRPFICRLLYGNAITMMETYLGDTLKREVFKDENSIRKFVEAYEPFSKIEIKLSGLFAKKDSLPKYIKEVLNSILYHDLPKIKPIYRAILDIDLGDIKELYKAVLIRHDLVHRNGKDKDGNEHEINEAKVRELLTSVNALIQRSEAQLVQNPTPETDGVSSTEFQFELPF